MPVVDGRRRCLLGVPGALGQMRLLGLTRLRGLTGLRGLTRLRDLTRLRGLLGLLRFPASCASLASRASRRVIGCRFTAGKAGGSGFSCGFCDKLRSNARFDGTARRTA